MTISIKSICGSFNEVPKVTDLKVTAFGLDTIDIEYKVNDVELNICRQYLILNGEKREITKDTGYESNSNIFKYKILELDIDTIYTIQIVASDGLDEGLSEAIQQKTKNIALLGIRVDESNSNPETSVTYLEGAVGMTPANSNNLGNWENKWPFNEIRIVGFKDGRVVKEIKKEDMTSYVDGTNVTDDVDVMVEFPKIYVKTNNITNGYEIRISDIKIDDSYECYSHMLGKKEQDYIYIGAYLGHIKNKELRSISNVLPTSGVSQDNFRVAAKARGNGYKQLYLGAIDLINILYAIMYKNKNGTIIGKGYTNKENKNKANTGNTNNKGFVYGEANGKEQMCFLGIEDLYGNLLQWLDGVYIDSYWDIMVSPDNMVFKSYVDSSYIRLGKCTADHYIWNGYTSKVLHKNKAIFFPMEFSGSNTSNYGVYSGIMKNNIVQVGARYSENVTRGIFSFYANGSGASSDIGGRLCYLGE